MAELLLQSAMEYLMTYSWAILIIAIVLGALFGLGFFNSAALAPKISAGSCQVYRPDGPGTTTFINTEGTCNNELPQYVAQFNGQSYIATGTTGLPLGSSPRSIFAWIYLTSAASHRPIFSYGSQSNGEEMRLDVANGNVVIGGFGEGSYGNIPVTPNTWDFVGFTYSGTSFTVYYNAQTQITSGFTPNTVLATTDPSDIGKIQGEITYFSGSIADVQVYNTSLSANEVTALYDEGIGGVPINLNNLVGWWPLNGNANDYSGNQNNGVPANIIYTRSWTSGYTAP